MTWFALAHALQPIIHFAMTFPSSASPFTLAWGSTFVDYRYIIYLAPGAFEICLLPISGDSTSARPQVASLSCSKGLLIFPEGTKFGLRVRKASVKNSLGGDLRRLGAVVLLSAVG